MRHDGGKLPSEIIGIKNPVLAMEADWTAWRNWKDVELEKQEKTLANLEAQRQEFLSIFG